MFKSGFLILLSHLFTYTTFSLFAKCFLTKKFFRVCAIAILLYLILCL